MKHVQNFGQLYVALLRELLAHGRQVRVRGLQTIESLGVRLSHQNLRDNILYHPVRDLNYRFMVAEWLWIMAGREDVETLLRYNKNYGKFSDDGVRLTGAYGPRLRNSPVFQKYPGGEVYLCGGLDQLAWCVDQLKNSPTTRQAVATIWTPCPEPSKDIPCTVSAQFLLRDRAPHCPACHNLTTEPCHHYWHQNEAPQFLHAIFTMRSSDAWLGLPYDWFTFTQLANCLAGELGVEPGGMVLNLGSSHLYEQHWELAKDLLRRDQEVWSLTSPRLPSLLSMEEFNQVLSYDPNIIDSNPWEMYAKALKVPSKKEAYGILQTM